MSDEATSKTLMGESLLKDLKRDSSLHFVPFRMTKIPGAQENRQPLPVGLFLRDKSVPPTMAIPYEGFYNRKHEQLNSIRAG